jgi:hypothetical protein
MVYSAVDSTLAGLARGCGPIPRVARSSQPWAGWNPVWIPVGRAGCRSVRMTPHKLDGSPARAAEKAAVQNAAWEGSATLGRFAAMSKVPRLWPGTKNSLTGEMGGGYGPLPYQIPENLFCLR